MISVVREPEVAEPLPIGVLDRRGVVDDPLGELHHGDVDLAEARAAEVARDLEHRLAELLGEDRPCARQQ